jgi:hypothetical protein
MIYGTATYYRHLRFEAPSDEAQVAALDARRPSESSYLAGLQAALTGARAGGTGSNGGAGSKGRSRGGNGRGAEA